MSHNYRNLPAWLTENPLFRRMFVFRKLYLSRLKSSHFSQFAEDVSIVRLFPGQSIGFFVDVGCFHPTKYNNTWMLYKRGWRGINIDIDAIKIEAFDIKRPADVNVNAAISNVKGELPYWSNGFYSLTISLDEEFVRGKPDYEKRTVQSRTLNDIIDASKYADKKIDLLSVDVEGHDLEVLQSLDFDRYQPRLVAVENHRKTLEQVAQTPMYQFIKEQGYDMVGWCGVTLLMASPSMQAELNES